VTKVTLAAPIKSGDTHEYKSQIWFNRALLIRFGFDWLNLLGARWECHCLSIDEERVAADTEALTPDADYSIIACQCNTSLLCANEILVQGDYLFVCVLVAGIQSFSLIQGNESLVVDAVVDSVEDDLTLVTILPNWAIIRSQMISAFFAVENPEDVSARGVVVLSLVSSSSNRRLRVPVDCSNIRALEKDETGFDVIVSLASSSAGVSGAAERTFTVFLLFIVGAVLFL
jgi:hypothetical protein